MYFRCIVSKHFSYRLRAFITFLFAKFLSRMYIKDDSTTFHLSIVLNINLFKPRLSQQMRSGYIQYKTEILQLKTPLKQFKKICLS